MEERSPNDPDTGNPQGARGLIARLLLIVLLGVIPAALLIYWGYFAPLTAWCNTQPLGIDQTCDYTVNTFYVGVHHHYTYAQAISYEMFRQWVERVIGPIWALLALRFVVASVRWNASGRAPVRAPSTLPPDALPSDGGAAYRRDRLFSALTMLGMVICALGLLALLLVPPELFPM